MAKIIPYTAEARWLMTAGAIACARMHRRGIPVDTQYCRDQQSKLRARAKQVQDDAWKIEGGNKWLQEYGSTASLSNPGQVTHILFDVLGIEPPEGSKTAAGKQSTKEEVLEEIDHPIVDAILQYRTYEKTMGTFDGIIRESVDGKLHPFFHVCGSAKEEGENTVKTYRTCSSDPNFQNMPIRDPEMGAIIRNAFRAPPGWCFVEIDYSKIEVHSACFYHHDPTMIKYLESDYDMHSDMAKECFLLSDDEYNGLKPKPKTARNAAKGNFVFAEFYGSFWKSVAKKLWKDARQMGLTLADGTPLRDHICRKGGISGLGVLPVTPDGRTGSPPEGSYYRHIQKVEDRFWKQRFKGYDKWKRDFYAEYQKKGYFTTLTGFRHAGYFKKNQVTNTPAQGTASHCKLRSLIKVTEQIQNMGLRGFPVAEIHDSIIALFPEGEVGDYLHMANEEMTTKVRQVWPWVITPISVEAECAPAGGTWHEKKGCKIP